MTTAITRPAPATPALPWRDRRAVRVLARWWPWLAAVASGLLLTAGLEPWNQEWACWVALMPLIAAVWANGGVADPVPLGVGGKRRWYARLRPRMPRERWARGFFLGYVTGLTFYWTAFCWLTEVTGPGWFILGFYMGLYPALFGWFVATVARPWKAPVAAPERHASIRDHAFGRRFVFNPAPASLSPLLRSRWNLLLAFLGASAWTAQEWLRGWLLSGFGWNDLGVSLHRDVPFLQLAEWTGVGGLSFLAAFVNFILVATVARFVLEVRAHRVRAHFDFTLTLAGLMLVFSFGIRTLQRSAREDAQPGVMIPLRVACVQSNIPQTEKWSPEFVGSIYRTLAEMSAEAAASRPQLLLWPEASTPYGMYDSRGDTFEFTHDIVRRTGANLLFGTLDYDFGPDGHAQADYNAAMMLVPGREKRVQAYRKIHLVPFGEYVPARALFGYLVGDKVPGDFGRGTEPGVFDLENPSVRVAPLICFEDTIGRVAREPVRLGAQLLVNLTNDGWFGHSAANRQQMSEAVYRAVENRRPLVACANTGVTAFVDREGRVMRALHGADGSVFGRGLLTGVVPVPARPGLTFYTRHGEVFSAGCAAGCGLAWFFVLWGRLRRLTIPRRPGNPTGEASDRPAAP